MIITEKEITFHKPETALNYDTLKEAIGGWLGSTSFIHPLQRTVIHIFCDDHYLDKDLPLNTVGTRLLNLSRAKESFHPVLGPIVLTKTDEEGGSEELNYVETIELFHYIGAALPLGIMQEYASFCTSEKETLTVPLEPVRELERVTIEEDEMKREAIQGFQHHMIHWGQNFVTIRTDHPDYRNRIKNDGRVSFYKKVREQMEKSNIAERRI